MPRSACSNPILYSSAWRKKRMHYIITSIDYPGTMDIRMQVHAKHLDYVHGEHDRVNVKLAGPLLARDGNTMIGSMIVIEAKDDEAAETVRRRRPVSQGGVVR